MFVELLLQIHSKYSELVKELFQNDQEFLSAVDNAFSISVNYKADPNMPYRSSEHVIIKGLL